MSLHLFGAVVTAMGTAANNRGTNEGNVTTLQKLVWNDAVHTTVSAEAIRFALRRRLAEHEGCNRTWNEDARANEWQDPKFAGWGKKGADGFIDDDLLGFMSANAASEEGGKGGASVRRAVLELTRAVSLTPWPGDMTFNAASPGATPSAEKKGGGNPVPYGTEMHATRYQYGFAMTPGALRKRARANTAVQCIVGLGEVAGNHGRFLFDFSPESIVMRITEDAAPRILYSFSERDGHVVIDDLIAKVSAGDIRANELVLGGAVVRTMDEKTKNALAGAVLQDGVKKAAEEVCARLAKATK